MPEEKGGIQRCHPHTMSDYTRSYSVRTEALKYSQSNRSFSSSAALQWCRTQRADGFTDVVQ